MKEIDVIVDLRAPLDSPDFVLVRQKFAVVDGELRSIGEPTESKLSLTIPRISTSVRWSNDPQIGKAIVATIRNSGFATISEITVRFVCDGIPSPNGESHAGTAADFGPWSTLLLPLDRERSEVLFPGTSHDWYLPIDFGRTPIRTVPTLPPEKYRLSIFAGETLIAEVPGRILSPILANIDKDRMPIISNSLQVLTRSLPASVRDRLTELLQRASDTTPENWANLPGFDKRDESLYLVEVVPGYRAFVRQHKNGIAELLDVSRSYEIPVSVDVNG